MLFPQFLSPLTGSLGDGAGGRCRLTETAGGLPLNSREGVVLDAAGVRKSYGETRALVGLDLQCRRGTVHTVFGENGSGKSTLVKILSGIIGPDEGRVEVNGAPVRRFEPNAMRALGIAPVLQEVLVAPNRSILDNIFLGFDGLLRRRIPREERAPLAARTLARITKTRLDLDCQVGGLPLAQQQLIVIARALVRDPSILILDEVTAALDIDDRETLFACIREFVAGGRLVVFISHRIDEVLGLSDEITVLRSGRTVARVPAAGLDAAQLLDLVCRTEPEALACEPSN